MAYNDNARRAEAGAARLMNVGTTCTAQSKDPGHEAQGAPETEKPTYAPIPARAMANTELSVLDLRVLMVIAAHDRFGKNGTGCYASHVTLARLVKCHLKSLSRCLKVLGERGYVEASPHPLTRKRVYRVIYTEEDKAVLKRPEGNETVTHEGNELVTYDLPEGNDFATSDQREGNRYGYPKEIKRSLEEITRSVEESPAKAVRAMKEESTTRARAREAGNLARGQGLPVLDLDDWRREADDPFNAENW